MPITQPIFDDVKPFPGEGRLPPRDHNRPPLDEMIVIEFNEAIEPLAGRITDLLAAADRAGPCTDDITAGKYGDYIRMVSAASAKVDEARVSIKAPYLAATRALDGRAKSTLDSLADGKAKVKRHLDVFIAAEEAKRRAEHERNMAEQRRLQAEAAAEAEKERQRLQAAADAEAAKERARLQAIEDERAAAAGREAAKVIVKAEVVEVEPEPVYVAPVAEPERTVVRSDFGSRVGTKTEWAVKIDSVRKLPDNVLNHPTVLEAIEKVLKARVRGGEREIKGCTITSQQVASIR